MAQRESWELPTSCLGSFFCDSSTELCNVIYVEMFLALCLRFGIVTSIGHDSLPAMLILMFVLSYALKYGSQNFMQRMNVKFMPFLSVDMIS